MNNDDDPGAVFAIPDLYGPSTLILQNATSTLFSQLKLDDIDSKLPDTVEQAWQDDLFFSIPELLSPPSDTIPTSSYSTDVGGFTFETPEDGREDIWLVQEDDSLTGPCHLSWEVFNDELHKEPCTAYITEAGPADFDTAIATGGALLPVENSDYTVVSASVYASSLHALGLGRSSICFAWVEEQNSFEPTLEHMRMPGYSGESLHRFVVTFLECGNTIKALRRFVEKAYFQSDSPGQVALADVVSTVLGCIERRLSANADYNSILQLQALFRPCHSILMCFQRIVRNVSALRNDEAMLSTVFEEIQLAEHKPASLKGILLEVLSRISRPWLEFVSEWLGLQREAGLPLIKNGYGKSFVRIENRKWVDEHGMMGQESDYALDYDKVPFFMAPEDARSMFEVGRSLRFLREHHSYHPIAWTNIISSANPPALQWKFSWQDVLQLEKRVLQYEKDLISISQKFSEHGQNFQATIQKDCSNEAPTVTFFGTRRDDIEARILASIDSLNEPIEKPLPDDLSLLLDVYLFSKEELPPDKESIFSFPLSLSPALSFKPIIDAQARIINRTCMKMFFASHHLREHLDLQRSFHLFGNGIFSSHLSHALFNPEFESAERTQGVARSGGVMGLRLGGRDTWPPASSELRLALMGVLTESYVSTLSRNISGAQPALPGDLSFAVRDMSEEEIERCMNADSIEAMDFLRLSYKPPPPLEAIISPVILFKYDQLFKFLLRIQRMLYVVSTLSQENTNHDRHSGNTSQRFRIEAQHFVSSISAYFFETGINSTWRVFERKLDQTERRLNSNENGIGENDSLENLRAFHERILDKIMFALLLRKRQQPVMRLLEDIFTLILRFSKHSRQRALGVGRTNDDEIQRLYAELRQKVVVFIAVCRDLSEKKGYADRADYRSGKGLFDGSDLGEENTIVQLLARLEMSDYYTRVADM